MQEKLQEQEIDLRDYIDVIIRRKWLIVTVFFISVIVFTAAAFLSPKIYMAVATVQNGNVDGALIEKSETEEILKSQDFLNPVISKLDFKTSDEEVKKAITIDNIKGTNFFRLVVKYGSEDEAFKICREAVDSYLSFGEAIYEDRTELLNAQLEALDNQIKNVEDDIRNVRNAVDSVYSSQTSGAGQAEGAAPGFRYMFLQEALSKYQVHLLSLINQRNELDLIRIKAKAFKLINPPVKKGVAGGLTMKASIVMSSAIGLIAGLFLAYFVEYLKKSK